MPLFVPIVQVAVFPELASKGGLSHHVYAIFIKLCCNFQDSNIMNQSFKQKSFKLYTPFFIFKRNVSASSGPEQAFTIGMSQLWHSLPGGLRTAPSHLTFLQGLKTFLFHPTFEWCIVCFGCAGGGLLCLRMRLLQHFQGKLQKETHVFGKISRYSHTPEMKLVHLVGSGRKHSLFVGVL